MKKPQAMGSLLRRLVLSASFVTASMVPLSMYGAEPGVLKGRVIDKTDGEGVVGASVVIAGTTIGTSTDLNGNFVLRNVPASAQKVSVSIVGYAPVTQVVNVGEGQTATANFSLGQTTIMASEVVVGAALYKQDRLDVPVTVNVVSKEKIKEEPNPTLDKVIEEVPGVVVNRAGGQTTSTISIRGSNTYQGGAIGTRVSAYYDGFPINTPETGEVVWSSVNMNAAEKVEVLKGSAATLYGSGAMGGVVNVYGALPDKFEVKAGGSIGFYDAPPASDQSVYRKGYTPIFWNNYVGIGNKSGKWNYETLFTHSHDDGYRQNTQTLLNDVKLKARYDINSKQYLQISSYFNESNGGYAMTWPYTISGISFVTGPVYQAFPERAFDVNNQVYLDDIIKRTNALIGLNYVNMLSDKLSLDTRLYYTYNRSRIEYNPTATTQTFSFSTPFGPFNIYNRAPGQFNETNSNRYGAGVKLDWRASNNHRLLFGVDGNITDVESTQYTAAAPVMNALTPIQEKNFAAFLQDEWKMTNNLTALISLRYDWSGIDSSTVTYKDYLHPIGSAYSGSYPTRTVNITNPSVDALCPRVALNYKATDDMSIRASWGKSFRAPTLAERFVRDAGFMNGVPNPNLDKETMTAYEVGIFKQFGEKVSVDIAGFMNDYNNLIESTSTTVGNSQVFQYRNITKARIWGIETSLNYRPTSAWSFNGAYTFMYAKNRSYVKNTSITLDQNPDPTWLPMRPEHMIAASATWKTTNKLSLNMNGRYVSKYKAVNFYTFPDGRWYPGDFVVFNASAKYRFTKNISASLACNNINNTQYEEAEWFRAPGRVFIAGIDLTY